VGVDWTFYGNSFLNGIMPTWNFAIFPRGGAGIFDIENVPKITLDIFKN
jgi:hypothetical protein